MTIFNVNRDFGSRLAGQEGDRRAGHPRIRVPGRPRVIGSIFRRLINNPVVHGQSILEALEERIVPPNAKNDSPRSFVHFVNGAVKVQ